MQGGPPPRNVSPSVLGRAGHVRVRVVRAQPCLVERAHADGFERVVHPYDAPGEPILGDESGTYADPSAPVRLRDVGFNHGLGSVVTALLDQGLVLERLGELDWSPYDIFPDMEEIAPGRYRMRRFGRNLPLVYGLAARRPR